MNNTKIESLRKKVSRFNELETKESIQSMKIVGRIVKINTFANKEDLTSIFDVEIESGQILNCTMRFDLRIS